MLVRVKVQLLEQAEATTRSEVVMAQQEYPKIITRPAKPPESYGGIDVSGQVPNSAMGVLILISAHSELAFSSI